MLRWRTLICTAKWGCIKLLSLTWVWTRSFGARNSSDSAIQQALTYPRGQHLASTCIAANHTQNRAPCQVKHITIARASTGHSFPASWPRVSGHRNATHLYPSARQPWVHQAQNKLGWSEHSSFRITKSESLHLIMGKWLGNPLKNQGAEVNKAYSFSIGYDY